MNRVRISAGWCAAALLAAALPARAGYQYEFEASGTVTAVNDLGWLTSPDPSQPPAPVHLLPGVSVGAPFTVSGTIVADASGGIELFVIGGGAPVFYASGGGGPLSHLIDPGNLGLGFDLGSGPLGGGIGQQPPALTPDLPTSDALTSFWMPRSGLTEYLLHRSPQEVPEVMSVTAEFTSFRVTAVPEPSAFALLAAGLLGAGWLGLRRPRARAA